jgi:hypothetical protein
MRVEQALNNVNEHRVGLNNNNNNNNNIATITLITTTIITILKDESGTSF